MTKELTILEIKIPTQRDEVSDETKINELIKNIESLRNNVLFFDTPEAIKESKKFKTDANKFIKEFKEFCDPLEEEGRTIAKTRSRVKIALDKIVEEKLSPIYERELELKKIKNELFITSGNVQSCVIKIESLRRLDSYDWLGLKEEALPIIRQSKTFFQNELIGFEKIEKDRLEFQEQQRLVNEQRIRDEATAKAKLEAQKAVDDANKRAEVAEAKVITQPAPKPAPINDEVSHQAKIHNEILVDLLEYFDSPEIAKKLIKAIAKKKIRNLTINY